MQTPLCSGIGVQYLLIQAAEWMDKAFVVMDNAVLDLKRPHHMIPKTSRKTRCSRTTSSKVVLRFSPSDTARCNLAVMT